MSLRWLRFSGGLFSSWLFGVDLRMRDSNSRCRDGGTAVVRTESRVCIQSPVQRRYRSIKSSSRKSLAECGQPTALHPRACEMWQFISAAIPPSAWISTPAPSVKTQNADTKRGLLVTKKIKSPSRGRSSIGYKAALKSFRVCSHCSLYRHPESRSPQLQQSSILAEKSCNPLIQTDVRKSLFVPTWQVGDPVQGRWVDPLQQDSGRSQGE